MVDLDKLRADLQEAAQMADRGHLTRHELALLNVQLGWTLVAVRNARVRGQNQRGYA